MSKLEILKSTYLEMGNTIKEMQEKQKEIAEHICKEIYPFEIGEKVLVKTSEKNDFVPGYFNGAYVYIRDHWNEDNTELLNNVYAIPKLKKVKKDGSMSLNDFGYISIFEIFKGTLIIKPYEE